MDDSLRIVPLAVQEHGEIVVAVPIVWLKIGGLAVRCLCIGCSAPNLVRSPKTRGGISIAGIKLQGMLELIDRKIRFARFIVDAPEENESRGYTVVQCHGLFRIRLRIAEPAAV